MKKLFLSLLVFLLLSGLAMARDMTIEPGIGIGDFIKIGTPASALASWGTPEISGDSDMLMYNYPQYGLELAITADMVIGIRVYGNQYQTAKGNTIGSSSEAIVKEFGQNCEYAQASDGYILKYPGIMIFIDVTGKVGYLMVYLDMPKPEPPQIIESHME